MAALKNHPGKWLNDRAAAAYNAFEAKYGVQTLNSAGRSEVEQQGLIDRWDRGGAANRPPYLYPPARPARASSHVKNGGESVDMARAGGLRAQLAEFDFVWYGSSDPVHYTHNGSTRFLTGGGAPGFPLPAGSYFGPKLPLSNKHSVSGYFGHGEDLKRWQQRMRDRGWQITADGRYGDQTRNITRAFQAEKGLRVDGLIGPATWAAAWTAPVT